MNCENRLLMWMKQMKMRNNNNKKESCERKKSHENDSCEDKWIMCKHYMWRKKNHVKINEMGRNKSVEKWIMWEKIHVKLNESCVKITREKNDVNINESKNESFVKNRMWKNESCQYE